MPKFSGLFLFRNQKGQALLIVILVMVVALTVGLSVVSRTIINLRNSSEQESSQKALSAAEAGVETAIKANTVTTQPVTNTLDNNLSNPPSYSYTVTQASGVGVISLNGGNLVNKNEGSYVWLSPYSATGTYAPWAGNTLKIYWGSPSDVCDTDLTVNTMAALEIEIVSGPKANPIIQRFAYDPCIGAGLRQSGNGFSSPTTGSVTTAAGTFNYLITIPNISSGLLAKVTPIYANTKVGVQGNVGLPSQGNIITSTGTADNAQRKVTVFQSYPELPSELFPYTLFSP